MSYFVLYFLALVIGFEIATIIRQIRVRKAIKEVYELSMQIKELHKKGIDNMTDGEKLDYLKLFSKVEGMFEMVQRFSYFV